MSYNLVVRAGHAANEWLARHPRVQFVFTPIWFGILSRSALRHRSFDDVRALTKAIYAFTKHWNNVLAQPFEWFEWTHTGRVLKA